MSEPELAAAHRHPYECGRDSRRCRGMANAVLLLWVGICCEHVGGFVVKPRIPTMQLGLQKCSWKPRPAALGRRMCEDGGIGRSELSEAPTIESTVGGEDQGDGGRAEAPMPEEFVKTEMWKDLWIRNVAHADTARRRTSEFFSDMWQTVLTKLPPAASAAADHYEEVHAAFLRVLVSSCQLDLCLSTKMPSQSFRHVC